MTTNTINNHVNKQIVLDTGNYGNALTVTKSGEVNGATFAIYGGVDGFSHNLVQNAGLIHGGIIGIELQNAGTLTNTGSIFGGVAGAALGANGSLINSGTISGGGTAYGAANAAVYLGEPNTTAYYAARAQNSGAIIGRDIGIDIINAYVINTGHIYGGLSGAALGRGSMFNTGEISGNTVAVALAGGTLANAGTISGHTVALAIVAGSATNDSTGLITAGALGVALSPTTSTALTFTNQGLITGGTAGVYLTASSLLNFGTIEDTEVGVYLQSGTVFNSGVINGTTAGAYLYAGRLVNNATISGLEIGVSLASGELDNEANISSGKTGVELSGGVLANTGNISGGNIGVDISGGTLLAGGVISGGKYAIYATNAVGIDLSTGATINGAIKDVSGNGTLILTGGRGTLTGIGTSINGFSTFGVFNGFYGSTWTLEGNLAGLATGQILPGFYGNDIIVITDFAATSSTYTTSGLVLSNGATTETLKAPFHVVTPPVYADNGKTYIDENFTPTPGANSIISGPVDISVTPGEGNYATGITITPTGDITTTRGPAILTPEHYLIPNKITNTSVLNFGVISGAGYRYAIRLSGDLTNAGAITGGVYISGVLTNSTQIGGGVHAGTLANSGIITGGVTALTLNNAGLIENQNGVGVEGYKQSFAATSTVIGSTDGVSFDSRTPPSIHNLGHIYGGIAGAYLVSRYDYNGPDLFNAGSIGGGVFGVQMLFGVSVTNSGTISGGTYAIEADIIYGAGAFPALYPGLFLTADPGAVFIGEVSDLTGTGTLNLAAGSGSLDMGSSFSGFSHIEFAAGAHWTLEGTASALTGGQTITGFGVGDTLVLDGFAATSSSYSPAKRFLLSNATSDGLVLSNATGYETLALNTLPAYTEFVVTQDGDGTAITALVNTIVNAGTLSTTFLGATVNPGYTLVNSGAITAPGGFFSPTGGHFGGVGVFFSGAGGDLLNTGTVFGNGVGVELSDGGTITNAGTIAAGADDQAIVNIAGAFTLVADPGAAFQGNVQDNAGSGVLILGGDTHGAINLTSFTGMPNITLTKGAAWSLQAIADGQTITGLTSSDSLTISEFTGPAGITLADLAATASSYAPGTGITLTNATSSETISFAGSYTSASFSISTRAYSTTITDVACFCAGTRIATPRGNIRVENLRIGDLVKTTRGPRPIRWIGTRTYAGRFIANNQAALPIRIRRHAIAFNIPSRDLYISPDHAICESGVLIHAHLLQNGVSITQLSAVDSVTYFHLELDSHAIIFAENTPTESFLDESSAQRFQNARTRPPSAPQKPCLPRVHHGFHLHNIKSRLKARAGIPEPTSLGPLRGFIDESTPNLIRGWVQDTANPEAPVLLEIFSGPSTPKTTPEIFSRPFFTQNPSEIFSARILANAYRPDLRLAGLGSGCHAFSLNLPNLQTPITVRRFPDGATLPPPPLTRVA